MKYKTSKKYQKELEEMIVRDPQIQYLENVFEQFQSDPLLYLETMSAMAKERESEQRGLKKGEKRGLKQGRKIGKSEGRIDMIIDLINDGTITLEQAANKLNISVDKMIELKSKTEH